MSDSDAICAGKLMNEVNKANILRQKWSLRDIGKIFNRIKARKTGDNAYKNININTEIELLFALSPISKDEENKEILERIFKLKKNC